MNLNELRDRAALAAFGAMLQKVEEIEDANIKDIASNAWVCANVFMENRLSSEKDNDSH